MEKGFEIARRPVESVVALFDTARFDHMQRIAMAMAESKLIPTHLQKSPADCLMILQQADRWQMDPFAVSTSTFVVSGKLGYEGKLVAAVINTRARLSHKLSYNLEGEGEDMSVTVSAQFDYEEEPRTVAANVKEARTDNKKWTDMPDQMLCYYGARKWGRRHAPELMLGVMTEDEIPLQPMKDITPEPVDLEAAGVVDAGETEPGTTAGIVEEQEGFTATTKEPVKPNGKATRKRVAVTFRGETLYKTKFLTNAKQALNAVEDEEEFDQLLIHLRAAFDSIEDEDQASTIVDELQPLIDATRKDFEEGEVIEEDAPEPAADQPAPLADVQDDLDLAVE